MLIARNGVAIDYDELGNPEGYTNSNNQYQMSWDGRRLTSGTRGGDISFSFTYNDSGIRTSKTVNGVKTTYYLDGNRIIAEETNNNLTVYIYDSAGSPIGFQYHGSNYGMGVFDVYWYEKNMQGDVVAVYNGTGTKLVSYVYDAYGNATRTLNGIASTHVAAKNPFTYRGYYYDYDLELYCVGTRYYDAEVGRWLCLDSSLYHSMLGYNMFVYCNNDPVMYVDYSGQNPAILLGTAAPYIVVGLFVIAVALLVYDTANDQIIYNSIVDTVEDTANTVFWVINIVSNIGKLRKVDDVDDTRQTDENGNPIVKPGEQPTEKDGYIAPKGGPVKGKTKDGKVGWKDKNGNIWVPAPTGSKLGHGGGHWDVQSPKGGYTNVYPGGKVRGGKAPYPNISIFP